MRYVLALLVISFITTPTLICADEAEERKGVVEILPLFKEAWNSGRSENFVALHHADSELLKEIKEGGEDAKQRLISEMSGFMKMIGVVQAVSIHRYVKSEKFFVVQVTYSKEGMVPASLAVKKNKAGKWQILLFDINGGRRFVIKSQKKTE